MVVDVLCSRLGPVDNREVDGDLTWTLTCALTYNHSPFSAYLLWSPHVDGHLVHLVDYLPARWTSLDPPQPC